MDEARRFLELIRRELGARDVRLELGILPPAAGSVSAPIDPSASGGVYVVAHFEPTEAEASYLQGRRDKLTELIAAFQTAAVEASQALDQARIPPASFHATSSAEQALTDALDLLAGLARAELALVIDDTSPEIWGASDGLFARVSADDGLMTARLDSRLRALDLDLARVLELDDEGRRDTLLRAGVTAAEIAGASRQLHRIADIATEIRLPRWRRVSHAIAQAREVRAAHEHHVHVRMFATIYRAVLVYDGPFSELHAEGALLRALPTLEKLVTSLPPRDPVSGGAKVAVLRRLRRV